MPTNRTKRKRQRMQPGELPTGHLEIHLTGVSFFNEDFSSEEERRQSYQDNQKYLLSLVGRDVIEVDPQVFGHGVKVPYGCRPHDWWRYEALPEPRRVFKRYFGYGDKGHTYYDREAEVKFTVAIGGRPQACFHYESQPDYLRRNNLLLPGEESKINPAEIPQNEDASEEEWIENGEKKESINQAS